MLDPMQQTIFSEKVISALGQEKLDNLLPQQDSLLGRAFQRMLDRVQNDLSQVTEAEIQGHYERITEEVYPTALKELLKDY